jgi:predicted S18 family serine protease
MLKTAADQSQDIMKSNEIMEAIKVAEKILPQVVDSSTAAMKDPTNLDKKNEFRTNVQRFNRALDRAGNKLAPKQDEKAVRDAAEELKKKIAAIRAAKRNKKDVEKRIEEANPVQHILLRSAERRINQLPNKNEDDMVELKNLWKKFGVGAKIGLSEKELDDIQKSLEASVKRVADATNANPIAMVQDVEEALDNLFDMTENHKIDKFKEVSADLTAKAHLLSERSFPEKHRERASAAFGRMNVPLKDVLQLAQESVRDPNNLEKKTKTTGSY